MKNQRLLLAFSLFNFGLVLLLLFHRIAPVSANGPASFLRARGLENRR